MSRFRRAVVQMRLDGDDSEWFQVGARTLYHYWTLLGPYFKGVYLAPLRKTDGTGVSWTWDQPDNAGQPTADDLKTVRQRISEAHRRFIDAVSDGPTPGTGNLSPEDLEELRARMGRIVANFIAKSERELIGYVALSGNQWMIHSWGAPLAQTPVFPDELVLAVSGRVLVDGVETPACEVVLIDAEGAEAGATRSDSSGRFSFSKLHPGTYRVRASSDRVDFPEEGVLVTLAEASVSEILLQAESRKSAPLEVRSEPERDGKPGTSRKGGSPWRLFGLLALLLLVGAGAWWYFLEQDPATHPAPTPRETALVARHGAPAGGSEAVQSPNGKASAEALSRAKGERKKSSAGGGGGSNSADVFARAEEAVKGASKSGAAQAPDAHGATGGTGALERPSGSKGGSGKDGQPSASGSGTSIKPWAKTRAVDAGDHAALDTNQPGTTPDPQAPVEKSGGAATPAPPKPRAPVSPKPVQGTPRDQATEGHSGEIMEAPDKRDATSEPTPLTGSHNDRTPTPSPFRTPTPSRTPAAVAKAATASTPASPTAPSEGDSDHSGDGAPSDASLPRPQPVAANTQAPKSGAVSMPGGVPTQPSLPDGHANNASVDGSDRASPPAESDGSGTVAPPSGAAAAAATSDAAHPNAAATPDSKRQTASERSSGAGDHGSPTPTPPREIDWQPALRVVQEPWRLELAADEILETTPTEGSVETGRIEALRAKRLRFLEASVSATFKKREVWVGLVVTPPGALGATGWKWRSQAAAPTLALGSFGPRGGEVWWRDHSLRNVENWTLVDSRGFEWARVRLGADGDCLCLLRQGVTAAAQVGLVRGTGEDSFGERALWADRLRWQEGRDALLPTAWERDDDWKGGRGHRLAVPLEPSEGEASWTIRLLDTETRWCIRGRITLVVP